MRNIRTFDRKSEEKNLRQAHISNTCNSTTYSTLLNNLFIAVYFIMTVCCLCVCVFRLFRYTHHMHYNKVLRSSATAATKAQQRRSTWIRVSWIASLHNSYVVHLLYLYSSPLIRAHFMCHCCCSSILSFTFTSIQYTWKASSFLSQRINFYSANVVACIRLCSFISF